MELPEAFKGFKFDLKDCLIETAKHATKNRPIQPGISNGEVDYGAHPGQDLESIANMVTVTHVPTGITATVSKFLAKRNREIAIALVKEQVEAWIAKRIEQFNEQSKKRV